MLQKVDALSADCGPNTAFVAQFFVQNPFFNFPGSGPWEWHLATEELICYDTQAPNIAPKVARLLQDHLRGLEPKCTTLLLEEFIVIEDASQTEVSDFDWWLHSLVAEEDILVLDVTVYDSLYVDIL